MDGLSVAASIIAVVDISVQVIYLCSQYSQTLANSQTDVSRLATQVRALKTTLGYAHALIKSPQGGSLSTSRHLQEQLTVCSTLLQGLQKKLERVVARQAKRRPSLRNLAWPITKDEIDASISTLRGYHDSIMAGLQIDQTTLLLRIKDGVDNFPTLTQEDGSLTQPRPDQSSLLLALSDMEGRIESARERREEQECLRLFRLTNDSRDATYESYKSRVEERATDTCQWFLNHETFQTWLQQTSGLLLVSADPGCGKSVLAKYLIERVLPDNATVCYFFFREQDQNTVRQALCAILHQLFDQKRFLIQHAMPFFAKDGPGLINTTESLWKILHSVVEDIRTGPVIIVLDALDECFQSEFAALIRDLQYYQVGQSQHTKLRYLFTSRPYEAVMSKFRGMRDTSTTVHIPGEEESDAIGREITGVIAQKVQLLSQKLLLSTRIKDHLLKRLQEIPHRTYLWVYLIFDYLEDVGFVRTLRGVDCVIASLPPTVDAAYEKILRKASDHALLRKALSIILAACRPLTLDEINIALSIHKASLSLDDLDMEAKQDFQRRLQFISGRFVSIHHDRVYLIHQTAREFLLANTTSPSEPLQSSIWRGTLTLHCVHGVLAGLCILYLKLFNADGSSARSAKAEDENADGSSARSAKAEDESAAAADTHALLGYAAENWAMHFRESGTSEDSTLIASIIEICDPGSNSYQAWFEIYRRTTDIWVTDFTSLMIASHFGQLVVVQKLLQNGASVERQDSRYCWTPLMFAAECGHTEIIKVLLENGAQLASEAADGANALLFAASRGREAATKILLEKGSGIESKDKNGRTALSLAAEAGHLSVVALLIGSDANIETRGKEGKTPLIYAVAEARRNVMSHLIAHGADVSAMDYERKGVLHHAIVNDFSKLDDIKTLISLGADVRSDDAENMTPMHYTVRFGRIDIAKLLFLAGVPFDTMVHRQTWTQGYDENGNLTYTPSGVHTFTKSGRGLTPLHYASWVGHDKMVEFFLQHGADPNALSDYGETPVHLSLAATMKGTDYRDYWCSQDWKIEAVLDLVDPLDSDDYAATLENIVLQRLRVLAALLNCDRTDVNIHDDDGESALHKIQYAEYARFGSDELVTELLQKNAVALSRPRDNKTPLHLACEKGDADCVVLLASQEQLQLRDANDMNALHLASSSGCIQTMEAVILACTEHQVDLSSTRDSFNRNALHCYLKVIIPSTRGVQLLLDYGVDAHEADLTGHTPFLL